MTDVLEVLKVPSHESAGNYTQRRACLRIKNKERFWRIFSKCHHSRSLKGSMACSHLQGQFAFCNSFLNVNALQPNSSTYSTTLLCCPAQFGVLVRVYIETLQEERQTGRGSGGESHNMCWCAGDFGAKCNLDPL